LLWLCLALGGLFRAAETGAPAQAPADATPPPVLTVISPPPVILPGQPLRVRLQWDLADLADAAPSPTADLAEARLRWGAMSRVEGGVSWEGDLVPLQAGNLSGQITCSADLPVLPADLPRATGFPAPSRYLANLYSPCQSRVITRSVALPRLAVAPWPPPPPGTPPFTGLLGTWSATLTAERASVSMREPLAIRLSLRGRGSATLFGAPALVHPDLDVLPPTVERPPSGEAVEVRWIVIPNRVPLEPLRLGFSTLDGTRYACHRLELALSVLPDPEPQAGGLLPPPVLLRFCPLPEPAAGARGGALAGGICAGFGALVGLTLAATARHRDRQRTPEGLRRAALKRLRRAELAHADDVPRVYHDLRIWLGLPEGAAFADIEAAIRPLHAQLADELRALETARFSPAPAAGSPRRLHAFLRRLTGLAALATLGLDALAALPPEESLARVAEDAFRQRDFAQACNALQLLRQRGRESPELLLNLANAYWFTGRRVEALALYERAVRQAPRRQDARAGLAWLRGHLEAEPAGPATLWTPPVRDWLRPDEWVFLAGLLVGLGCLTGGLLRCWHKPTRYALAAAAGAAFACLWFATAQWTGTYRVGATARLTQPAPLRAAPAASAEVLTAVLPAGTLVTPTGEHADWLQVRTPTAEGWVPETGCILVW
jgi:tetratricopeptide (TPR) repeat protein